MTGTEILQFIISNNCCPDDECKNCPLAKLKARENTAWYYSCWVSVLEDSNDFSARNVESLYSKKAQEILVQLLIERSIGETDES